MLLLACFEAADCGSTVPWSAGAAMSSPNPAPLPGPPKKLPRRPASSLAEKWTRIDDVDVFYRESPRPSRDPRVMAHVHGFGLSGRYLLPTAEMLADEFHTYVPDL